MTSDDNARGVTLTLTRVTCYSEVAREGFFVSFWGVADSERRDVKPESVWQSRDKENSAVKLVARLPERLSRCVANSIAGETIVPSADLPELFSTV